MYNVYVPMNRSKEKDEFKEWCIANVGLTSSDTTWIMKVMADRFVILYLFDAADVVAFKLKFGL